VEVRSFKVAGEKMFGLRQFFYGRHDKDKRLRTDSFKLILTDLENPVLSVSGNYKIYKNNINVHNCTGCFGCWIKQPGICLIKDDSQQFVYDLSRCSQFIIISRCVYGDVSPFIKKMQDRSIPNLLPFFTIRKKQMHHMLRYSNKYSISAYFYGHTSDEEKETATEIIYRNSLNTDSYVKVIKFYEDAKSLEGVSL